MSLDLDVQINFGEECSAYGGCILKIKDPSLNILPHNFPGMRTKEFILEEISIVRFQDRTRNFYMLLDGSMYLKYGAGEFVPVSSPYNSTEWQNYIDYWNYDEVFRIKSSSSSVFLSLHLKQPPISPVSVKVLPLEPGSVTKTIDSNSHLVLVKRNGQQCWIDGVEKDINHRSIEHIVTETKDINFSVTGKSYLICLQS